jgi:hypothetical protein
LPGASSEDEKFRKILDAIDEEDAKPPPEAPAAKPLAPTMTGTIKTAGIEAGSAYVPPTTLPPGQEHRTFRMAKVQLGPRDPSRNRVTTRVRSVSREALAQDHAPETPPASRRTLAVAALLTVLLGGAAWLVLRQPSDAASSATPTHAPVEATPRSTPAPPKETAAAPASSTTELRPDVVKAPDATAPTASTAAAPEPTVQATQAHPQGTPRKKPTGDKPPTQPVVID